MQDYAVAVRDRRAKDGFANRPYDNVGVAYGLEALRGGTITTAQFVDLNAKIGSHDIDYERQPQRVACDRLGLHTAYRAGLYNQANNLDRVLIIDVRGPDNVEIHHHHRSWVTRARLDRANGHHDNQVIWYGTAVQQLGDANTLAAYASGGLEEGEGGPQLAADFPALDVMDDWVAAIKADASPRSLPERWWPTSHRLRSIAARTVPGTTYR